MFINFEAFHSAEMMYSVKFKGYEIHVYIKILQLWFGTTNQGLKIVLRMQWLWYDNIDSAEDTFFSSKSKTGPLGLLFLKLLLQW
jgi:hypothetical protein